MPSPLAEVKASLKDDRKADVVFTVTGDTPSTRLPLAVLTDYDGVIWTVADPQRDAAATEFVPVDTELPELDDAAAGRLDRGRAHGRRSTTSAATSCPPPASPALDLRRPTARRSIRGSTCAPGRSPSPAACPTG